MHFALLVDWLQLNLRGRFSDFSTSGAGSFVAGLFSFDKQDGGTQQYLDRYVVKLRNSGEPFGVVCSNPRSSILPVDSITFKMDNARLYEQDLYGMVTEFLGATGFCLEGVTRIDYALDLERFGDGTECAELCRLVAAGQLRQRSRRPASWALHGEGHNIQGLSLGKRSSDRCVRLYNKSKEMAKSGKKYIKDFHSANGLGGDFDGKPKDVWRFEVMLKSQEIKKFKIPDFESGEICENKGLTLEQLLSFSFIRKIMQMQVNDYFTFIDEAEFNHKGNASRCQGRDLIQMYNEYNTDMVPETRFLVRHSAKNPSKLFRVKVAVKALLSEYYSTKDADNLATLVRLAVDYDLSQHVERRLPFWQYEFRNVIDESHRYENVMSAIFDSVAVGV